MAWTSGWLWGLGSLYVKSRPVMTDELVTRDVTYLKINQGLEYSVIVCFIIVILIQVIWDGQQDLKVCIKPLVFGVMLL